MKKSAKTVAKEVAKKPAKRGRKVKFKAVKGTPFFINKQYLFFAAETAFIGKLKDINHDFLTISDCISYPYGFTNLFTGEYEIENMTRIANDVTMVKSNVNFITEFSIKTENDSGIDAEAELRYFIK